MKSRLFAAGAVASTAALTLALVPATAAPSSTTESETFRSSTGLSDQGPSAELTQLPTSKSSSAQRAAAAPGEITQLYVRGYQTIYSSGLSYVLGDVKVEAGGPAFCRILSVMNVNGKDRAEGAATVPGTYNKANPNASGRIGIIPKYGAASYRFGPSYFLGNGADGICGTADDSGAVIGQPDPELSNTLRIRYASKGTVKYTKTGSKVKVHVLAQRFDKAGKYVGLRSVKVQFRKAGTTTWKTRKTMPLDVAGRGDYYFTSAAKYYYRVAIVQTDNVQSAYSPASYL